MNYKTYFDVLYIQFFYFCCIRPYKTTIEGQIEIVTVVFVVVKVMSLNSAS